MIEQPTTDELSDSMELDDARTFEWLRNQDDWFEDLPTLGELADEPGDAT